MNNDIPLGKYGIAVRRRQTATMPPDEAIQGALGWLKEHGPVEYLVQYGRLYIHDDIPGKVEAVIDQIYFCDNSLHPAALVFEKRQSEDWGITGIARYDAAPAPQEATDE